MSLPLAAANLVGFARLLRQAGFGVAPEQGTAFLQGVTLLGPRSMDNIRQAALATLAPAPDRRAEFDALFRSWFWGDTALVAFGDPEDETRAKDDRGGHDQRPPPDEDAVSGETASSIEQLAGRTFQSQDERLAGFARRLAAALPHRRSFRDVRAVSRGRPDLRRSLREIVASDGDLARLTLRRRPLIQRRLLVFIDISGSMKAHTADHLRLAHAVIREAERAEVFTLGTRLTRITAALDTAQHARAMTRVSETVEDWDGGTRIGPTLLAFLGIPRFSALARGAAVLILSDGLERGGHAEMELAFRRLQARAHRLSLATPLAADPRFRPRTAALRAVLPYLDDLVDGSDLGPLTDFILSLARPAPRADTFWREVS